MGFFSGIPYKDQVSSGGSGSGAGSRSGLITVIRKLGAPVTQFNVSSQTGRLAFEEWKSTRPTANKRRWLRRLHRKATGWIHGAISGAATGGLSAFIYRKGGKIADLAPEFAQAARRGSVVGAGLKLPQRMIEKGLGPTWLTPGVQKAFDFAIGIINIRPMSRPFSDPTADLGPWSGEFFENAVEEYIRLNKK